MDKIIKEQQKHLTEKEQLLLCIQIILLFPSKETPWIELFPIVQKSKGNIPMLLVTLPY